MPITLYEKQDFKGSSLQVSYNIRDLHDTPVKYKTSSARIEGGGGALLFTKTGWDGKVMCRRSIMGINDMGDYKGLGRLGFDNSVKSVRITPFTVNVRYAVVINSRGHYPGGYKTWSDVNGYLNQIHRGAKDIWAKGFVDLVSASQEIVEHDGYFRIDSFTGFLLNSSLPAKKDMINVYLVDEIRDYFSTEEGTTAGQAPYMRQSTKVALKARSITASIRTLAHEIGHVFGLPHGSKSSQTLMRQSADSSSTELTNEQLEDVHQKLSVKYGTLANLRRE